MGVSPVSLLLLTGWMISHSGCLLFLLILPTVKMSMCDPLSIAEAADGRSFTNAAAVQTEAELAPPRLRDPPVPLQGLPRGPLAPNTCPLLFTGASRHAERQQKEAPCSRQSSTKEAEPGGDLHAQVRGTGYVGVGPATQV